MTLTDPKLYEPPTFDPTVTIFESGSSTPHLKLYFVDDLEIESNGNIDTVTTQCGYTEASRQGDTNWTMTIRGKITKPNLRALKSLGNGTFRARSELHSMKFIVQDLTISQTDDLYSLDWKDSNNKKQEHKAFSFQLQLKSPTSSEA